MGKSYFRCTRNDEEEEDSCTEENGSTGEVSCPETSVVTQPRKNAQVGRREMRWQAAQAPQQEGSELHIAVGESRGQHTRSSAAPSPMVS